MWVTKKMKPEFRKLKGGLFDEISKADVGGKADEMMAKGVDMLCWADPFFPDRVIPDHVKQAAFDAFDQGIGEHYTTPIGNLELKKLISEKLKKSNGLDADPERNIIVTPGSDSALFFSLLPFIAPGDEALIPDPSYPNNFQAVSLLGGVPVPVPLTEENAFRLNRKAFEEKVTDKTKLVILTNPNNPTTVVYSEQELRELSEFIKEHSLMAIVDQAFEDIVFDGKTVTTMAALEDMWERTITVFSLSKGMALSGLRVGYIAAHDRIMDSLYASAVSVIGATNSAAQAAATAVYRTPGFIRKYRETFDQRRKFLYEHISQVPGVSMLMPQSSFLSWINISKLGTSDEIVAYLTEEAKVFVNAGHYYGSQGEGYIRLVQGCFKDDVRMQTAIIRVRDALMKLSAKKYQ